MFSFVSSVFSFFKFSCNGFLSHRIPVFLHQTPVVRATACWTPPRTGLPGIFDFLVGYLPPSSSLLPQRFIAAGAALC
jgi:hypothetical protein